MFAVKFIYGILLVILGFFLILYRGTLSLQLFILALLLPIVLFLLVLWQKRSVSVSLGRSSSEIRKDEPFQWILQTQNKSIFPVANAVFILEYRSRTEDIPRQISLRLSLLPRNMQRTMLTFHAAACGVMEMRLVEADIYDPLRMFRMRLPQKPKNAVLIMPDCLSFDAEEWELPEEAEDDATEFSKNKPGDDPSEVFEIHEYRSGDAVSRIHWKLSSKLDELMVKAYSLPIHSDVMILPDYRKCAAASESAARLDTVMSVLYALSNRFRMEGRNHSILWYQKNAGGFVPCPLNEPEDTEEMIRQILLTTPAESRLLRALDALESDVHCTQLLLLIPHLDEETQRILPQFAEHRQLLVFYAQAEDEADVPMDSAGYTLIPVRIPKSELKAASAALEEGDELLCEEP